MFIKLSLDLKITQKASNWELNQNLNLIFKRLHVRRDPLGGKKNKSYHKKKKKEKITT